MSQKDFLEQLPYAAFELDHGAVCAVNAAARAHFPSLTLGDPLPEGLAAPLAQGQQAGSFRQGEEDFFFARAHSAGSELILFRPAREGSLTDAQLDGFSRQMRSRLGDLLGRMQVLTDQLREQDQTTSQMDHLHRSFHQMLHLVNDLDFLNIPDHQAQALFRPAPLDLALLCTDIWEQCVGLLAHIGITLTLSLPAAPLIVSGDRVLLERMLLALISNAAKACPGGEITLTARTAGDRGVLTLTDSAPQQVDLSRLESSPAGDDIPAPQQGAGMGLDVVRRIVALHAGTLLTTTAPQGGLCCTVSLPTAAGTPSLTLNTPKMEMDGGISPVLTELADLLPPEVFSPEPN